MRALLVVNPAAGSDRAPALLPFIETRLRAFVGGLDIVVTATAADAEDAGALAARDGYYDALYIAGGDGTINTVVRGLVAAAGYPDRMPRLPIGVLPLGTGNDFAKSLDLGEELEQALDVLSRPRVIDVDIGTVNGVPFINASAGGFTADVSEAVTDVLKDVTGKLAYVIGGARVLLSTLPFSATVTISEPAHGDVPTVLSDVQLFAAANGQFIGGGYPIAPSALLDDGLLEALVVPRISLLDFIGVLRAIAAGEHLERPDVLHFRASSFDLAFDRTVRVNTDGEVMEAERCEYRVQRRALRFFCGVSPHSCIRPSRVPRLRADHD